MRMISRKQSNAVAKSPGKNEAVTSCYGGNGGQFPHFSLSADVYACATSDHGVLLDLRRDEYVALGPRETRLLGVILAQDLRMEISRFESEGRVQECKEFADELLSRRLIVPCHHPKAMTTAATLHAPTCALLETALLHTLSHDHSAPTLRFVDVWEAFLAYIRARRALRFTGLYRTTLRLARRRRRCCGTEHYDFESLREATQAYLLARPYVFSWRERCLLDSLALIEFLAMRDLFPMMVIGVSTKPFASHCWVQAGVAVLNDAPAHVSQFQPIFAV